MIWNDSLSVWELRSCAYYKTFTMMGKYLIQLTREENLMMVYALKLKILLDFLLQSAESNQITELARAQFSQMPFSWWVKHQKSLERVSRSSQLHIWGCDGALGWLWPPIRRISEYTVKCQLGFTLASHIIHSGEIRRVCTVEETHWKNALQQSQQELRDQVKVQQTPPWS